jgi:hypothetical protein
LKDLETELAEATREAVRLCLDSLGEERAADGEDPTLELSELHSASVIARVEPTGRRYFVEAEFHHGGRVARELFEGGISQLQS